MVIPRDWDHAGRVIGDWIRFYNCRMPHRALRVNAPQQTYQQFQPAA